jgi:2-keto-3-deoxy-L-arabinonate dehydratase
MNTKKEIAGIVPIIPTPFAANEEVDETALRKLIDFAISCQVEAACLPAYASEFYKLTDDERVRVVKIAVEQSAGRIQIVAQSNHPSFKVATEIAKRNIDAGADIIALAVPRIFHLPEDSLKEYLGNFMKSVSGHPVLIQDFNPGGTSLSVQIIKELALENPNFKYLKLEEPLSAPKLENILKETGGAIKLMEGWGGLYMLELIPVGISGVMPGLGVADILQKVFALRKKGEDEKAFDLFEKVMPQIFFSLQNMELFHYVEKQLLVARGVLDEANVRKAAYNPDAATISYAKELNARVVRLANELID